MALLPPEIAHLAITDPVELKKLLDEIQNKRNAEIKLQEAIENANLVRGRCQSLVGFIREAWAVLEPNAKYIHNWHIDAICQHLEAVTDGRINRLLINVPPGPMRADSMVETARGPVRLDNVVVGDSVLTHRARYRRVEEVHRQGILPILRIETNAGRVTHAAPSHPFLTPKGWIEAGALKIGDVLAAINPQEQRTNATKMSAEEARLLGYIVGDGSVTHSPGFINGDREIVDDFRRCAASLGLTTSERRQGTFWKIGIRGAKPFLERHGLAGKSSYTKQMPPDVRAGTREVIANFIGAYWSCDGGIDVRATRSRGSRYRAYATTVSSGLADDLLHGLAQLGISASVRRKARPLVTAAQPGGVYRSFSIEIQNEAMTARLVALPGLCPSKKLRGAGCRSSFDRPIWDDSIVSIQQDDPAECLCLTVEEDHSFVCSGIAVKNSMKSLIVSVFWPAWEWAVKGLRSYRYLTTAFNDIPVKRDTGKMRSLIQSEWFNALWPDLKLKTASETKLTNFHTGERRGVPFGSLTSQRGDRLLCDDVHSTEQAESEAERRRTTRRFREGAQNRLNDQQRSAIVVIMQRLHEDDVSGTILKLGLPFVHLMIPMEFETARKCVTRLGPPPAQGEPDQRPIFWQDPRTVEGELVDPVRMPKAECEKLRYAMGEYGWAGQYQQRPAPREGGLFDVEQISVIDLAPRGRSVRGWDIAGSKRKTSPYTVGVKLVEMEDGRVCIVDVRRKREGILAAEQLIVTTANHDGIQVMQSIPQDPGSAGLSQKAHLGLKLKGSNFRFSREQGEKQDRAIPISSLIAAGLVTMVKAPWNSDFIEELRSFPNGSYMDQVDALSRAYHALLTGHKESPGEAPEEVPEDDQGGGPDYDDEDAGDGYW